MNSTQLIRDGYQQARASVPPREAKPVTARTSGLIESPALLTPEEAEAIKAYWIANYATPSVRLELQS
jgi:hypothetical protein